MPTFDQMNFPRFSRLAVGGIVLAAFITDGQAHAQVAPPTVSVSFGIDTTITDVGDIVRLVRAYLANPDSSTRSRGLWSTTTDFDRRIGDLTSEAYQGFPATIIGVASDGPGDSVYVVRVLYARADSAGGHISPLAFQRLYAVRESASPFRFRLSGALPRLTRGWERRSKGRVTFWYAPGQHPNPAKVSYASAFVDSVVVLFDVPPNHLDMYVAESLEQAQRAIGLDFFPQASVDRGRGGQALRGGIVLAGNPAIGEAYAHELVHAILGPAFPSRNGVFGEGVATWLGGSRGRTPQQMYARLRQIQIAHPTLTLGQVLRFDIPNTTPEDETDAFYATGALIVDTAYRLGGIARLRALAQMNRDPNVLQAMLPTQLGLASSDQNALDRWWRIEAARKSGGR